MTEASLFSNIPRARQGEQLISKPFKPYKPAPKKYGDAALFANIPRSMQHPRKPLSPPDFEERDKELASRLDAEDKLKGLRIRELPAGVMDNIYKTLSNTEQLSKMTKGEFVELKDTLIKEVPEVDDWESLGIPDYVDYEYFNNNTGKVMSNIFARAEGDDKLAFLVDRRKTNYKNIAGMIDSFRRGYILDMDKRQFILKPSIQSNEYEVKIE